MPKKGNGSHFRIDSLDDGKFCACVKTLRLTFDHKKLMESSEKSWTNIWSTFEIERKKRRKNTSQTSSINCIANLLNLSCIFAFNFGVSGSAYFPIFINTNECFKCILHKLSFYGVGNGERQKNQKKKKRFRLFPLFATIKTTLKHKRDDTRAQDTLMPLIRLDSGLIFLMFNTRFHSAK